MPNSVPMLPGLGELLEGKSPKQDKKKVALSGLADTSTTPQPPFKITILAGLGG